MGTASAAPLTDVPEPRDRRRVAARHYQLKSLTPRHRRIMLLELHGLSVSAICRAVAMRRSQVGAVINSILYRRERERLLQQLEAEALASEGAMRRKLDYLAGRGVLELERILDDPTMPPRLRMRIAFDALDRAGITGPDGPEVRADFAAAWTAAAIRAHARHQALKKAQEGSAPNLEALPAPAGPSSEPPAADRQA